MTASPPMRKMAFAIEGLGSFASCFALIVMECNFIQTSKSKYGTNLAKIKI